MKDELTKLRDKATQGEWVNLFYLDDRMTGEGAFFLECNGNPVPFFEDDMDNGHDGTYIAALHNALPELLATIEGGDAARKRLIEVLEEKIALKATIERLEKALNDIYISGINYCSEEGALLDVEQIRDIELIIDNALSGEDK